MPFSWAEAQQQTFDTIISSLTNPPILAYADYSLPFELHTDASLDGLGAVLYQEQEGKKRVVAYASRSLKVSEKNYPAHKLEFLALKWAVVEKFHDYLYGSKFEAVTDNNPLTYVFTTAKLDATGQRWVAELSNYNFCIKFKSGRNNADGLSRRGAKSGEEVIFQPSVGSRLLGTRYYVAPTLDPYTVGSYINKQSLPYIIQIYCNGNKYK